MLDALELPGVLCAVIPLMCGQRFARFRRRVVHELVALAHRLAGLELLARSRSRLVPGFAAVIGSLNNLSEPAGSLRCIELIWIGGGDSLQASSPHPPKTRSRLPH